MTTGRLEACRKMTQSKGNLVLSDNRRARYNYFLLEHLQVGIALLGTEVKSARDGKIQISDAYAVVKNGELWLMNVHIGPYGHGNRINHEPLRPRKLLAKRNEINRLYGKTQEKGLTLIPTRIYLERGRVKCDLALAKAKKLYDKREKMLRRDAELEAKEAIRGKE